MKSLINILVAALLIAWAVAFCLIGDIHLTLGERSLAKELFLTCTGLGGFVLVAALWRRK